jgi:hypothetical protein
MRKNSSSRPKVWLEDAAATRPAPLIRRDFRKGHKTSASLPFLTTATWDAVQVDIARIVDRRLIGKVVLPYFWISCGVQLSHSNDGLLPPLAP